MVVGVGFCKIKVDSNFLLVLKIKCTKFYQDRSKTVDLHKKYTNRHSVLYTYIDWLCIPHSDFVSLIFLDKYKTQLFCCFKKSEWKTRSPCLGGYYSVFAYEFFLVYCECLNHNNTFLRNFNPPISLKVGKIYYKRIVKKTKQIWDSQQQNHPCKIPVKNNKDPFCCIK
jgi:hypothetical protein